MSKIRIFYTTWEISRLTLDLDFIDKVIVQWYIPIVEILYGWLYSTNWSQIVFDANNKYI